MRSPLVLPALPFAHHCAIQSPKWVSLDRGVDAGRCGKRLSTLGEREKLQGVRTRLEEMARELHAIQGALLESQAQRTLRSCAMRINWAAGRLTVDNDVPRARQETVQSSVRLAAAETGGLHGTAVVLLALLMGEPGRAWSSHRLASAMGIAQKSVRVFAFHVRKWLQQVDMPDALQTHVGIGYGLGAGAAEVLRLRFAALGQVADLLTGTLAPGAGAGVAEEPRTGGTMGAGRGSSPNG